MANHTGHRKLLEQLRADGIKYLFGNPGSSEEGLLDEVTRFPDITYILGLQEAAIVAVADGYAQATQKPAVVQLHTGVGLGIGTSGLYHALRKRTPLLVLAGEAGVSVDALEAHMAIDLVALARPVTKYAARATHPGSLLAPVAPLPEGGGDAALGAGVPRPARHPRSAQQRAGGADSGARDARGAGAGIDGPLRRSGAGGNSYGSV